MSEKENSCESGWSCGNKGNSKLFGKKVCPSCKNDLASHYRE